MGLTPTQLLATDSHYLDDLVKQADTIGLADDPGWHALGHYRPDWFGSGHHSLIDSPDFFLAEDGKVDPRAELRATLRAFFAPSVESDDERQHPSPPVGTASEWQHPQCAFIARYGWLKERLDFDPERLPEQSCSEFDAWSTTINATAATLIFPAAYMNNPASMFGHTLLRLDQADQTEETRLLSYAVNYGAETGDDNGLLFAVHGLTGGYPGTYSIEPYYELVKRYSDLEHRDIHEYALNFSEDEVARMVAHLWELRGHYSEYYFFDENCSYQLLFLLDVARPSLDLAGEFALHVIPIESVRAVLEKDGLFKSTTYRPSGETRIRQNLAGLSPTGRQLARDLAEGFRTPDDHDVAALPVERQAAVVDLAEAVVTYRMANGDLPREEASPRALQLLTARSRIEATSDLPPIEEPATRPDQGHASARFGAGFGLRDGRPFTALRFRPAYHDDLDPSGGYVPGAAIDFLAFELRHYDDGAAVTLEKFTAVGIRSMTPRDELFQPLSWSLNVGLDRLSVDGTDEEGALIAAIEGGAGLSYGLGAGAIGSMTLDVGLTGGEDCDETCSANAGPALSLLWPVTDNASFTANARYQLRFGERVRDRYELRVGQGLGIRQNLAWKLEAGLEDEGGGLQSEFLTFVDWYF